MRIVLMGQAAFGAKTLEALMKNGEEVIGVYLPPDRPGSKEDPLKSLAMKHNLPVFQPVSYHTPEVLAGFRSLSPDLLIMAFVTDIIPVSFLECPKEKSICYHPSLLPRHRGGSAINWAVIMGDESTGLTIFWPDGGIDTGPILLQKVIPIKPEDTTGSLYFNSLFPMGIDAIVESVKLIKEGTAPKIPQDENQATYEPLCDDKVSQIEWSKPGTDIYNLIRGCDPQPGAYYLWKGDKIRFYSSRFLREKPLELPGTIVDTENGLLRIATADGIIEIGKVRTPKLGKVKTSEFINASGIKKGDRFNRGQRS